MDKTWERICQFEEVIRTNRNIIQTQNQMLQEKMAIINALHRELDIKMGVIRKLLDEIKIYQMYLGDKNGKSSAGQIFSHF